MPQFYFHWCTNITSDPVFLTSDWISDIKISTFFFWDGRSRDKPSFTRKAGKTQKMAERFLFSSDLRSDTPMKDRNWRDARQDVRLLHWEDWKQMNSNPPRWKWGKALATNVLTHVAHPSVQKVAGLPKGDLSQPDWKILHQNTQAQQDLTVKQQKSW